MTSCCFEKKKFFPLLVVSTTWLMPLVVLFLVVPNTINFVLAVDDDDNNNNTVFHHDDENFSEGKQQKQKKKKRVISNNNIIPENSLLLQGSTSNDYNTDDVEEEDMLLWTFDGWIKFHKKVYVDIKSKQYRKTIFDMNVAKWRNLNNQNIIHNTGGGANYGPHNEPYADLTVDEYIQIVANCYNHKEEEEAETSSMEAETDSTASVSTTTTRHHLRHLRYGGTTTTTTKKPSSRNVNRSSNSSNNSTSSSSSSSESTTMTTTTTSSTSNTTTTTTTTTTFMRIDWRNHLGKSYVTPVKDQGPYGTCWSFAVAENLEGLGVRQGFDLMAISEQEFISCCPNCQGRSADITFQWLLDNTNGHPAIEKDYPYVGNVTKCHNKVDVSRSPLQLHSWGRIVDNTEDRKRRGGSIIEDGLFEWGPMGLGVDASCFHGYRSGIVRNCTSSHNGKGSINHAVLMVAAGTDIIYLKKNSLLYQDDDDDDSSSTMHYSTNSSSLPLPTTTIVVVDFFTIKNSWSTKWGEDGYVRIEQGKDWWGPLDVIYTE